MSDQIRQAREASVEVYRALRDTREGEYSCVPVGITTSLLGVHEVFHVSMLRKYTQDPAHVVDWGEIVVDTDETFEEGPMLILDSREQVLSRKTVRLVKILWQHRGVEEATWEREDTMRATYPFLFKDEGKWFSCLVIK